MENIQQDISPDDIIKKISDDVNAIRDSGIIATHEVKNIKYQHLSSVIDGFIIKVNKVYSESPSIIKRVEVDNKHTRIVISQGLTIISSKAKNGKSQLAYIFAATALGGSLSDLLVADLSNSQNEVTLVDTEQSNYEAWEGIKKIHHLLIDKVAIDKLCFLALRTLTFDERLQLVEEYIYKNPNIGLLIIDGIRDFICDPNSMEEANMIVSRLLKWATELHIAIVVVIHQNKGDNNIRGFLGTELNNKASVHLSVECDEGTFKVFPVVTRNRPFTPFVFKLDENGMPFIVEGFVPDNTQGDLKPDTISDATHHEVLLEIFKFSTVLPGWSDLLRLLRDTFSKRNIKLGEVKIRSFIAYYLDKKWLVKEPVAGRSYGGYRYAP
jgi:hypothetical protein